MRPARRTSRRGNHARRGRPVPRGTEAGPGAVSVWMTRDPVRVAVNCPVARVARLMETQHIRHVLVMDGDRLAGIVSNRDVRGLLAGDTSRSPLSASSPVSEAMTEAVVATSPATPLTEAAREMLEQKIGALPIVEEGRLVGILTKSDALEALLAWAESARST